MLHDIAIVVIGRNEGERLRACLESVAGKAAVVYVDSGSTDGSAALATEMRVDVVSLDSSLPFTAARARNEGFNRIQQLAPAPEFVQFIDGDCTLIDGWLEAAHTALRADEKLAAVCGRRRERFPERSIYNAMMDLEWDTPIGSAASVGGDATYRVVALKAAGGFNAEIAAGEEPELCLRLRELDWKIERLASDMTWHDAHLLSFGVWWQRQIRSGQGAMDVSQRTSEKLFAPMNRSVQIWTVGWVSIAIIAALIGKIAILIALLAVPIQMLRIARMGHGRGVAGRIALAHGFFTVIGKWPMLIGQIRYWRQPIKKN